MANDVAGPRGAGRGAGEPPRATGRAAPRAEGRRPKFRREMARAVGSPPEAETEPSEFRWPEGQGLDPMIGLAATARRLGRGATKPDFPEAATGGAVRDRRAQPAARPEEPSRRPAGPATEAGSEGGGGRSEPGAADEAAAREPDAGTRARADTEALGRRDAGTRGREGAGTDGEPQAPPEEAVTLAGTKEASGAPVAGALAATAAASAEMAGPAAAAEPPSAGGEGGAVAPVPSRGPDRAAGSGPRAPAGDHLAPAAVLAEEASEAERYRGLPAVRLDLEPEDLGRVRLHVALADQRVFAAVVTEQEGLRDYLQAQCDRLEAELGKQGLEVGSFLVSTNRREGGEPGAPRPDRPDRADRPSRDEQPAADPTATLRADGLNLFA